MGIPRPGYFEERYKACAKGQEEDQLQCEREVRSDYRKSFGGVEDEREGRLSKTAEAVNLFLFYVQGKGDPEGFEKYKNATLGEIANQHGIIEEMRKF